MHEVKTYYITKKILKIINIGFLKNIKKCIVTYISN